MIFLNKILKSKASLVFIIVLLLGQSTLLLSSCKKDNDASPQTNIIVDTTNPNAVLASAKLVGTYSKQNIATRFGSNVQFQALLRYDVKVYKLEYKTLNTDGSTVKASGALVVPVTTEALPLVSQQHGTITDDNYAPSNYQTNSEIYTLGTGLASNGYIVAAPDYIGYGSTKHLPHPYEHAATLASASLDMIKASREFLEQNKIPTNQKLFLTGYSEGGFATMSLHKLIEEKNQPNLTVTASAPGAGAYDKTSFAKFILGSSQPLSFINTYLWVLDTYNKVYQMNRPMAYFLNEPYATSVETNGVMTRVEPNPQKLFTATFREGVMDGSDKVSLDSFRANDVYDWKPQAPIALFHGTADDFVPFFNSQNAYDAMQRRGANQVQLRPIAGKTHISAVPEFILGTIAFFGQF